MKICVVGLGYVGLPLAVRLAKNYKVTGFEINSKRVDELIKGHDSTNEVSFEGLSAVNIEQSYLICLNTT